MLGRKRSLDYGRGFLRYGCPLDTGLMPTLEEIETTLADVKRVTLALAELEGRRQILLGQLADIGVQMATAKASVAANEAALRKIAPGYSVART